MKFFNFLKKIFDIFLIFFLGNRNCLGCKNNLKIKEFIEKKFIGNCCWENIKKTIPIKIFINKKDIKIFSLGEYSGPLKKILYSKYYGNSYVYNFIGDKIAEKIIENKIKFDYIIPVPQHFIRRISRGFNQTELIANSISNKTGIPVLLDILYFNSYKKEQNQMEKKEKENLEKNIFYAKNLNKIYLKKICIIDDIYTTGYTIKNIIKTLKNNFENCSVFVAARCKQ